MKKPLFLLVFILLLYPNSGAAVKVDCLAKAEVVELLKFDKPSKKVELIIRNNTEVYACAIAAFSRADNSPTRKISASWNLILKNLTASSIKAGSTVELDIYKFFANTPNGPVSGDVWEITSVFPQKN